MLYVLQVSIYMCLKDTLLRSNCTEYGVINEH
jgi:hypothetical protein